MQRAASRASVPVTFAAGVAALADPAQRPRRGAGLGTCGRRRSEQGWRDRRRSRLPAARAAVLVGERRAGRAGLRLGCRLQGRAAREGGRPAPPRRATRPSTASPSASHAAQTGQTLDRTAAAEVDRRSARRLPRPDRSSLPVKVDPPQVTVARLVPVRRSAERVVSAPVVAQNRRWPLRGSAAARSRRCCSSRRTAATKPALGGAAANAYFARLDREVEHAGEERGLRRRQRRGDLDLARDDGPCARRAADGGAGCSRRRNAREREARVAHIASRRPHPERSTAEARAMGITGVVGSYETIYGGIANRIHNVQLVAKLIDGKLIAPGATFSFNGATGERTRRQGLPRGARDHQRRAPDRARRRRLPGLDDRLQRRLRGRAADHLAHEPRALHLALPARPRRDGGLPGHRPQVRERHRSGSCCGRSSARRRSSSTSTARRSTAASRRETSPLRVVARLRRSRRRSTRSGAGRAVVEEYGVPAQATSVHRLVYSASGKLLSDATWNSSYRSEPKIVLSGRRRRSRRSRSRGRRPTSTHRPTTPARRRRLRRRRAQQ